MWNWRSSVRQFADQLTIVLEVECVSATLRIDLFHVIGPEVDYRSPVLFNKHNIMFMTIL